jgi:hypothetical protein
MASTVRPSSKPSLKPIVSPSKLTYKPSTKVTAKPSTKPVISTSKPSSKLITAKPTKPFISTAKPSSKPIIVYFICTNLMLSDNACEFQPHVTFANDVTNIPRTSDWNQLQTVIIPDTVLSIGDRAFSCIVPIQYGGFYT